MASTTRLVSARERARKRAAEYRERERLLEDLGVAYFSAEDELAKIHALRDRELARVRERAERNAAESIAAAAAAIRSMLELGTAPVEVRERLGGTAADIRRAAASPSRAEQPVPTVNPVETAASVDPSPAEALPETFVSESEPVAAGAL